ncbi:MAG: Bcr/CflA family multidrug efflux MFS transporter [Sciscionella sp.]
MAQEASAPRRSMAIRFAFILGALSAFGPLSIDMYLPALPAMAHEFGAGASAVQLTLSACVLGLGAGQLLAGPLSDTLGRRLPLLVGLAGYTVFSLGCAVSTSVGMLIGFRLLQAFGGAAGLVIARAVVRDLYSGRALARFFSALMLVNGVAPVAAPIFGGQLLRFTSWRGVFITLTVIGVALLIACLLALPETLPPQRRAPGKLRAVCQTYRRLLADREFLGYVLAGGFAFAAMFAYISGSSFVLQNRFGLSPQLFSVVFGVNSVGIVALGQLNGLLLRHFEPRKLLAWGLSIALCAALALLAAGVLALSLFALLIPLFFVVSSIGLIAPNTTALALAEYPRSAGAASALLGVGQFLIGGLAAPLVGIGNGASAVPMVLVIAASSTTAMLLFLALRPSVRRAGNRTAARAAAR